MGNAAGSGLLGSQIACPIGPVVAKAGFQQEDHVIQAGTESVLPLSKIVDSNLVIRVLPALGADADDDSGTDQPLQGDLVHRLPVLEEMDGSVQVGAAMFGHAEAIGRIKVSARGDAVEGPLQGKSLFGGPEDGLLVKGVGQVDEGGLADRRRAFASTQTQEQNQRQNDCRWTLHAWRIGLWLAPMVICRRRLVAKKLIFFWFFFVPLRGLRADIGEKRG